MDGRGPYAMASGPGVENFFESPRGMMGAVGVGQAVTGISLSVAISTMREASIVT